MAENDKLIEIMSEVLFEMQGMRKEQKESNSKIGKMQKNIETLNVGFGKMQKNIEKLNLGLAENTRAILQLADRVEQIGEHEKRLDRIERALFK